MDACASNSVASQSSSSASNFSSASTSVASTPPKPFDEAFIIAGSIVGVVLLCIILGLIGIIVVIIIISIVSRNKHADNGNTQLKDMNDSFIDGGSSSYKASIVLDSDSLSISFGELKILQKIGLGSFGVVYKGEFKQSHEIVGTIYIYLISIS